MSGENKQAKYSFVGSWDPYFQFFVQKRWFFKHNLVIAFLVSLFHAVLMHTFVCLKTRNVGIEVMLRDCS